MRRIAILGSTGSIGKSTLKVIEAFAGKFRVVGLSAYSNIDTLLAQAKRFSVKWICLVDACAAKKAKSRLPSSYNVLSGSHGLCDLIRACGADSVVFAITGSHALMPLLEAIRLKKIVILANKEALVIAGPIIMQQARKNKVEILPVDSEQSAIWQCLNGRQKQQVRRIYLTASGGPFKNYNQKQIRHISLKDVLSHPCWKMGRRITVDSATLMNKGFEIIEAMWLFGLDLSQIQVVIHPEAVIHSMVEFTDGIIMAQLSITDMRIPIQYALTYPHRFKNMLRPLDFFKLKKLTFQRPDVKRFPCLRLAYQAASERGTLPCVLNAADEVAVDAFLNRRINFVDIPELIAKVIDRHKKINNPSLEEILLTDAWARDQANLMLRG